MPPKHEPSNPTIRVAAVQPGQVNPLSGNETVRLAEGNEAFVVGSGVIVDGVVYVVQSQLPSGGTAEIYEVTLQQDTQNLTPYILKTSKLQSEQKTILSNEVTNGSVELDLLEFKSNPRGCISELALEVETPTQQIALVVDVFKELAKGLPEQVQKRLNETLGSISVHSRTKDAINTLFTLIERDQTLKVILERIDAETGDDNKELVEREDRFLNAARGSGITPQVFSSGKVATNTGERHVIVMEKIEGSNIVAYIDSELAKIPASATSAIETSDTRLLLSVEVLKEILNGMSIVHEVGPIGDIKPENLIRLPNGKIKFIDAGTATIKDSHLETAEQFQRASRRAMGTPGYTPVGQAHATRVNDIHALGALAFKLVTGDEPVDFQQISDRLDELSAQLPVELVDLIKKATNMDPGQRFTDAKGMKEALDKVKIITLSGELTEIIAKADFKNGAKFSDLELRDQFYGLNYPGCKAVKKTIDLITEKLNQSGKSPEALVMALNQISALALTKYANTASPHVDYAIFLDYYRAAVKLYESTYHSYFSGDHQKPIPESLRTSLKIIEGMITDPNTVRMPQILSYADSDTYRRQGVDWSGILGTTPDTVQWQRLSNLLGPFVQAAGNLYRRDRINLDTNIQSLIDLYNFAGKDPQLIEYRSMELEKFMGDLVIGGGTWMSGDELRCLITLDEPLLEKLIELWPQSNSMNLRNRSEFDVSGEEGSLPFGESYSRSGIHKPVIYELHRKVLEQFFKLNFTQTAYSPQQLREACDKVDRIVQQMEKSLQSQWVQFQVQNAPAGTMKESTLKKFVQRYIAYSKKILASKRQAIPSAQGKIV